MDVAILGASGKTGKHLVKQALANGHQVVALVHGNRTLDVQDPALRIVTGDARNTGELVPVFRGRDAVISVVGSNRPGHQLLRRSTRAIIDAAHATGVKRVVSLSSMVSTDRYRAVGIYKLFGGLGRGVTEDKKAGEELLRQSDLDWTIVHASLLDKTAAGSPVRRVGPAETVTMANGIARADVAAYLLRLLDEPSSVGTAPIITST